MSDLPRGTLYVVATPLGNLEDVTLRALRILEEVALVACEDTRRTGDAPPRARDRDAHDVVLRAQRALEGRAHPGRAPRGAGRRPRLRRRDARASPIRAIAWCATPARRACPSFRCPGPSAAVAALSVSGLPTDRFLFVGLPAARRPGARRRDLDALAARRETLVFYESPQRVLSSLADMIDALGDREAFLFREATKMHEEYVRGRLSDAACVAGRPRCGEGRDRAGGRGRAGERTRRASPEARSPG